MESLQNRRYIRQIALAEVGEKGMEALKRSSVLVIGAGGLGCPALLYLAAAGIGTLGIIDFDRVDLSNLHRQILYSESDVGSMKAETAAQKIKANSPHIVVEHENAKLTQNLAMLWFQRYDLIVDATDQVAVRYMISDACQLLNKPWVHGAVDRWSAQWILFPSGSAGYRSVFPVPPNPMTAATCEQNGVMGMVPGIAGTAMALEAVKHILGIAEYSVLQQMDLKSGETFRFLVPAADSRITTEEFLQTDYETWVLSQHYP